MPSLVVIRPQIKEKQREGTMCPPAYMVTKYPSLNRVKTITDKDYHSINELNVLHITIGRLEQEKRLLL